MRWFSQPPRAPTAANVTSWAKELIAWLDRQERQEPVVSAISEVMIDNAALLNTNVKVTHGLNLRVLDPAVPNCVWVVCGVRHSCVGAAAGSGHAVVYADGMVGRNDIELRFFANTLTVNGANPITFQLTFYPEFIPRIPQ